MEALLWFLIVVAIAVALVGLSLAIVGAIVGARERRHQRAIKIAEDEKEEQALGEEE